jgi:hypothetical protein
MNVVTNKNGGCRVFLNLFRFLIPRRGNSVVACFGFAWFGTAVFVYRTVLTVRRGEAPWPTGEYRDIVAGGPAFSGYSKTWDYRLAFGSILVFVGTWCLAAAVLHLLGRKENHPSRTFEEFGNSWLLDVFANALLNAFFWLISLTGIFAATLVWIGEPAIFLTSVFSAHSANLVWLTGGFSYLFFAILEKRGWLSEGFVNRFGLLSQLFAPLIFHLAAFQASLYKGALGLGQSRLLLRGILGAVSAGMVVDLARRLFRKSYADRRLPVAGLLSLAFFLCFPRGMIGRLELPRDAFHFGEVVIAWEQIFNQGLAYMREFIPLQGGFSLITGAFNHIFFSGTAGTFQSAMTLVMVLLGVIGVWGVSLVVSRHWAIALVFSGAFAYDRFVVILPLLCFLAWAGTRGDFILWVVCASVSAFFAVYMNFAAGTALTLSAAIVGAGLGFSYLNRHRGRVRKSLGADMRRHWLLVLTLLALLAACGYYLGPILAFVGGSASTNGTAYGIGIFERHQSSPSKGVGVAFKFVGWLIAFSFLFYGGLCALFTRNLRSAIFCWSSVCFIVFCIPYAFGRVDPQALSRVGILSCVALGGMVPLWLMMLQGRRRTLAGSVLIWFLILLSRFITQDYVGWSPGALAQEFLAPAPIAESDVFVPCSEGKWPKFCDSFVSIEQYKWIAEMKQVTEQVLLREETYLDFTNRPALYQYLDRKAPAALISPYVIPNAKLQRDVIRSLQVSRPPLIYLAPANNFDYWSPSLRTYRVYDWVMELNYALWVDKIGQTFLIDRKRASERALKVMSDFEQVERLDDLFANWDLRYLPMFWGQSWEGLQARFILEREPSRVELTLNSRVVRVSPFDPLTPSDQGRFLKVKFVCSGTASRLGRPATGTWLWNGKRKKISFQMSNQWPVVLPLGSFPSWRSLTGADRQLEIELPDGCSGVDPKETNFLKLVD